MDVWQRNVRELISPHISPYLPTSPAVDEGPAQRLKTTRPHWTAQRICSSRNKGMAITSWTGEDIPSDNAPLELVASVNGEWWARGRLNGSISAGRPGEALSSPLAREAAAYTPPPQTPPPPRQRRRLDLGSVSAASRLHLGCISAPSRLHLGSVSAPSRLHLGCISAASRLRLGCVSAPSHRPRRGTVGERRGEHRLVQRRVEPGARGRVMPLYAVPVHGSPL